MNNTMGKNSVNTEQLSIVLKNIIKEIGENEDPMELDEYRRVFKKNVSIFHRAYVAAYLLKYLNKGKVQKWSPKETVGMDSLFMSIGRNRKIFPRDIIGIILDKTDLNRSDIGNIKILDNYSFVDISSEKADTVVQALNDLAYRGRTLTVNRAKKRSGE